MSAFATGQLRERREVDFSFIGCNQIGDGDTFDLIFIHC